MAASPQSAGDGRRSLLSSTSDDGGGGGASHVDEVFRVLQEVSLRNLYPRFSERGVHDAAALAKLTDDELERDFGVESAEHRKQLRDGAEAMLASASAVAARRGGVKSGKKKPGRRVSFALEPEHEVKKCYHCRLSDPGMGCAVCKAACCAQHAYVRRESTFPAAFCTPYTFHDPATYTGPLDDAVYVCWRCDEGHGSWRVYHRVTSCLCAPCDWVCGSATQLDEVPLVEVPL